MTGANEFVIPWATLVSPSAGEVGMVRGMNQAQARTLSERRAAALEHLRSNSNLWLATASDERGPHLIPVSYWWDGTRLLTATFDGSRTLRNVRVQPRVRAAVGSTEEVLMIDAMAAVVAATDIGTTAAEGYARASGIPRSAPGFTYVQLVPERMQVWKGPAEFSGRTVMRAGMWLDDPVD
jgi:Pyridoxamine 5'-phosphate oxidase